MKKYLHISLTGSNPRRPGGHAGPWTAAPGIRKKNLHLLLEMLLHPKHLLRILFSAASRGDMGPQQLSGHCSQRLGLHFSKNAIAEEDFCLPGSLRQFHKVVKLWHWPSLQMWQEPEEWIYPQNDAGSAAGLREEMFPSVLKRTKDCDSISRRGRVGDQTLQNLFWSWWTPLSQVTRTSRPRSPAWLKFIPGRVVEQW